MTEEKTKAECRCSFGNGYICEHYQRGPYGKCQTFMKDGLCCSHEEACHAPAKPGSYVIYNSGTPAEDKPIATMQADEIIRGRFGDVDNEMGSSYKRWPAEAEPEKAGPHLGPRREEK